MNSSPLLRPLLFAAIAAGLIAPVSAQTNTFPSSGNVGIGTTTPASNLHIVNSPLSPSSVLALESNINSVLSSSISFRKSKNAVAGVLGPVSDYTWLGNMAFSGYDGAAHNLAAYIRVSVDGTPVQGRVPARIDFATQSSAAAGTYPRMRIAGNGNVGIGETNPQHKLAVNGTIKAREVIVETTGWSDYVFADDYRLAPLSEVESHIKTNRHLPGIPSATQVAEQGVSLGDMQAKLLAKVEELTLHVIAQEKHMLAQERRIAALESENASLKVQP